MSRDYWRALEQSGLADFEVRYAMAYRDGVPVAAAAMQLLAVSLETMHAHPGPRAEGSLRAALAQNIAAAAPASLGLRQYAQLRAGWGGFRRGAGPANPLAGGGGNPVPHPPRGKAERPDRFRAGQGLDAAALEDSRALGKLSYSMLQTEPNMVLPLAEDWRVYEDYLAGMTSKYRSSIRQQIFKPIEAAGCEIGVMTPQQVDAQAQRMQQLYLAVQDNATLRPVTVTADYWRRMAALDRSGRSCAACGAMARCWVFAGLERRRGSHRRADRLRPRRGQDAAAVSAPVAHGDRVGAGRRRPPVIFGRTALEPKARMGCQPVPTTLWIRHRQPVLNSLIRNRFGIVHHDEAPAINPFKK